MTRWPSVAIEQAGLTFCAAIRAKPALVQRVRVLAIHYPDPFVLAIERCCEDAHFPLDQPNRAIHKLTRAIGKILGHRPVIDQPEPAKTRPRWSFAMPTDKNDINALTCPPDLFSDPRWRDQLEGDPGPARAMMAMIFLLADDHGRFEGCPSRFALNSGCEPEWIKEQFAELVRRGMIALYTVPDRTRPVGRILNYEEFRLVSRRRYASRRGASRFPLEDGSWAPRRLGLEPVARPKATRTAKTKDESELGRKILPTRKPGKVSGKDVGSEHEHWLTKKSGKDAEKTRAPAKTKADPELGRTWEGTSFPEPKGARRDRSGPHKQRAPKGSGSASEPMLRNGKDVGRMWEERGKDFTSHVLPNTDDAPNAAESLVNGDERLLTKHEKHETAHGPVGRGIYPSGIYTPSLHPVPGGYDSVSPLDPSSHGPGGPEKEEKRNDRPIDSVEQGHASDEDVAQAIVFAVRARREAGQRARVAQYAEHEAAKARGVKLYDERAEDREVRFRDREGVEWRGSRDGRTWYRASGTVGAVLSAAEEVLLARRDGEGYDAFVARFPWSAFQDGEARYLPLYAFRALTGRARDLGFRDTWDGADKIMAALRDRRPEPVPSAEVPK